MYTLLATDATNSGEHIKAIPILTQARDLCLSGQYPELDTISLVSYIPNIGRGTHRDIVKDQWLGI